MVLLAGGRGRPQGPVPTPGTRRHGRAGLNGTRPPARHRHGSHEQRSLPQRVRLWPLLPLHAQRRLQGRASPGGHRGGGGHHHPLPTGPLHRRRVRAAEPHRDLGRQVLLPGAEVRVDEGRAGVRSDVLQAECDTLQSGQDHAAPLQEEGRVSRVSRRPAALGQFHLCQQPGSQSGEWPRGEGQMNGPHRHVTPGVINISFWKPTQFAKRRINTPLRNGLIYPVLKDLNLCQVLIMSFISTQIATLSQCGVKPTKVVPLRLKPRLRM